MASQIPTKDTIMISSWSHAVGSWVDLPAETHTDSQVRFSENTDLNKVRTSFLCGRPYMCSYFDLLAFILIPYFVDPSQIEVADHKVNIDVVERVLSNNIYINQYRQPRSQEVRVKPTILFVAQLASASLPSYVPIKFRKWLLRSTPSNS